MKTKKQRKGDKKKIRRKHEKKERNSNRQRITQHGPDLHDFTDTYV